jgi:hypothetical protein
MPWRRDLESGARPVSPLGYSRVMGGDVLSDDQIASLLAMPKKVTQAPRKAKVKAKHEEYDFAVEGADGTKFTVYARQSLILAANFSCGLKWEAPSGEGVTLVRYNGNSHPHGNRLEGTRFVDKFHIHRATERYLRMGLDSDGFAEETSAYSSLSGAVKALAIDCHVQDLSLPSAQGVLFGPGGGGK